MNARLNPITVWAFSAVTVLITAFVLWLGWPAQAAELPAGTATVEVYLIDDELTTPEATGQQAGWFGGLSMPCDFDSWYVESAGTAMCAVLDGPKGTVTVTRTGSRIELAADAQKAVTTWAGATSAGGGAAPTRALLVRDGEPAGVVTVADPSTATPAG